MLKWVSVVRLVRVSKVTVEATGEERETLSVAFTAAVELITSGSKEGDRRSTEEEDMSDSISERVTTLLLVSSTVV